MIFRPLYNVENENQSQNPARSNVSNPPIFGTVELISVKIPLVTSMVDVYKYLEKLVNYNA